MTQNTTPRTDETLIQAFSSVSYICLQPYTDEELKRVLLLGVSGKIHLPQTIGNQIDESIMERRCHSTGAIISTICTCDDCRPYLYDDEDDD